MSVSNSVGECKGRGSVNVCRDVACNVFACCTGILLRAASRTPSAKWTADLAIYVSTMSPGTSLRMGSSRSMEVRGVKGGDGMRDGANISSGISAMHKYPARRAT